MWNPTSLISGQPIRKFLSKENSSNLTLIRPGTLYAYLQDALYFIPFLCEGRRMSIKTMTG